MQFFQEYYTYLKMVSFPDNEQNIMNYIVWRYNWTQAMKSYYDSITRPGEKASFFLLTMFRKIISKDKLLIIVLEVYYFILLENRCIIVVICKMQGYRRMIIGLRHTFTVLTL